MPTLFGLTRVRNESHIIKETLDHLSEFCNGGIFVYDDCSTDNTAAICEKHPNVKCVVKGYLWDSNRAKAEFENRQTILLEAKKHATKDDWFVYIDADERIEFDWNKLNYLSDDVIAVRMKLFDFYITPEDIHKKYYEREWLGPEYREITIAYKNTNDLKFEHYDQREVTLGKGRVISEGFVKHYGKGISVEQWEETCKYYTKHFPQYSKKWEERKGKAIHNGFSDFDNPLIKWEEKNIKSIKSRNKSSDEPLNILISNHHLLDYTGSEIYTLTLAEHLLKNNCNVTVYSKYIDKTAKEFEKLGISVYSDLRELNNKKFDVAHVHHNINAAEVRYFFPELPIVFLSHGVIPFLEQPPTLELGIAKYLSVSEEVKQNLLNKGIDESRISVLHNLIDEDKFCSSQKINPKAKNVLVISGRIDEKKESIIIDACKILNLNLKFVGGRFGQVEQVTLKQFINESDIVFSLGRGAVEAIFMGRIPIIYDYLGGDGMVTSANIEELMECNFSGRKYKKNYSSDDLVNEISKYDPLDVDLLREKALQYFSAKKITKEIIDAYQSVINFIGNRSNVIDSMQIENFVKSIEETRNYTSEIERRAFRNQKSPSVKTESKKNNSADNFAKEQFVEFLIEIENLIRDERFDDALKLINENTKYAFFDNVKLRNAKIHIKKGNLLFAEIILENINKLKDNSKYYRIANQELLESRNTLKIDSHWTAKKSAKTLIEAERFIEKNKLVAAEKSLLEILNAESHHTEALNNLAVVYILKEEYKTAYDIIRYLLGYDSQNEVALGNFEYLKSVTDINLFEDHNTENDDDEAGLSDYEKKLNNEIAFYADSIVVHDLPKIHNIFSNALLSPQLKIYTGFESYTDWWIDSINKLIENSGRVVNILSLGCGNGDTELEFLKKIKYQDQIYFLGIDINPNMVERANNAAKESNQNYAHFKVEDLNKLKLEKQFDVFIANHSLHHLVNLEGIFSELALNSSADMMFLINDMIGKNGHQMWNNTKEVVTSIWENLDMKYKYNAYFKKYDKEIMNIDCSTDGFEGIRAQDIIPLLNQFFDIEFYFPFATIINRFTDRAYGHNFNVDDPADVELILKILEIDIRLLEDKKLSATQAFIKAVKKGNCSNKINIFQTPEETVNSRTEKINYNDYKDLIQNIFNPQENICEK